ncbi:MAG TPA: ATP-binding protein, partial [Solirubrobacteraceae bacterium]|nr:ATP-binding protein [Solirubrobacteraceae bacterium]
MLERERELRRLAGAVERAADRDGALVLIEGPAGIGKTALLRAARERSSAAGFTVLSATAAELDRGFPFGVVHQLLGPVVAGASEERRARLLAGAAAAAEVVLSPAGVDGGAGGGDDPGYAVLHGLYWLLANLAEEEPVALLVDDLHWADRASLRLLEYLGRRLEGLPLLVVGTTRGQEPGAEQALLADLAAGPSAEVLRPSPLSVEAAATVIEAALGRPPDPAFVDACIAATGGTPLLVRAIADRAADEGLRGAASEAARVTALGAAGLGRMMHRRLASLGPDALALARAGAVLGERRRLDDLAAVAGLDAGAAAAAADALAGAGLLDASSWAFVHPVVRAAVADGTPPGERTVLHARAARRLRASGVRADEVAVHLLAAEPSGDPQVVAILREAARSAVAGGAPEAAVAHLRRALAEPPPSDDRAALLLELGELEVQAGDGAAIGHLTDALDAGLTGNAAARARGARAFLSVMGDPTPIVGELERALADAEDPALRLRLESNLLDASIYHSRSVPQRAELLRGGGAAGGAEPSVVLLAHQAVEASYIPRPAAETIALAQRAAAGGELVRAVGPDNSTFNLLTHAFRYAERADLARALLEEGEAAIQRTGLRFGRLFLEHAWGYWHLNFGRLGAGLAEAQSGLDRLRAAQLDVTAAALIAIVAELLVELDRADEAAPLVDAVTPEVEETVGGPFAVAARGA